jgi:predicted ATPase
LKSTFDIREDDGRAEVIAKCSNALKFLGADEAATLPYLLELLSVKDSGLDAIWMSPEAKKERTIEALNKVVLQYSEYRPWVMAIEDLHWIDKTSEDSFKYLLENIWGSKVFLIFTYRAEFVPAWQKIFRI